VVKFVIPVCGEVCHTCVWWILSYMCVVNFVIPVFGEVCHTCVWWSLSYLCIYWNNSAMCECILCKQAVLWNNNVMWDVTLCHWIISSWFLLRMVLSLSLLGQAVQEERLLDPEVESIFVVCNVRNCSPVTQYYNCSPVTQYYNSEDWSSATLLGEP
jgi:hypothetical protein